MRKKSALRKDFYMEIKKSWNRFLSIFLIVALGVAFFAGIRASKPDMRLSADLFYDNKNFMDIRVISSLGLTDEDVEEISGIDGVKEVMPSYSGDYIYSDNEKELVIKTFSLPDKINQLTVKEGRLPDVENECFIDEKLLNDTGYKLGDKITLKSGTEDDIEDSLNLKEFVITGTGTSPYYLSMDRGTSTIGNGDVSGFIVLKEEVYNSDVYTEIYVNTVQGKNYTCYTKEYDDYIDIIVEKIENIADSRCEIRYKEVINEGDSKIKDARDKLSEAKEELKKAEEELKDAKSEIDKGKKEIEENEDKLIKAKEEITDKEAEINEGKDKLSKGREEISKAKKEIKDKEKVLSDSEKEIKQGEEALISAKKTLSEKEEDLKKGKEDIKKNEETLAALKLMIQAGDKTVAKQAELLEQGIEKGKKELSSGEKQIKIAKAEINKNSKGLSKAKIQLEEGKKQIKEGKLIIEEKEKLIDKNEKTLIEGEDKIIEAKEEIASNEEKLSKAKADILEGEKEYNDGNEEYIKEKEKADKKISEAEDDILEGENKIKDIKYPEWYVLDRNYIQTYVEYGQDSDRIGAIGEVFPLIFFLVAALVSLTTMTRMVEEERTQIGTLKALGYSKIDIAMKYIMYAFLASILGSIFGLIIGQKLLPQIIINAYGILYNNLPEVVAPISFYYSITSILAAVLCTTLATVFACYKELAAVPAKLMRPVAPKSGKRVLIEKISFIWKRLNFSHKAAVRNLFRYKKRFFMTVLGIGGCMSLLIVGYGIMDSIKAIGTVQFGEIRTYSASIGLKEKLEDTEKEILVKEIRQDKRIEDSMYAYETSIDIGYKDTEKTGYIVACNNSDELKNYITLQDRKTKEKYKLSEEGAIITEKLAKLLGVKKGDVIYLKTSETEKVDVKITGIVENYFMHYVYMSKPAYEKAFGKSIEFNEIFVNNIQDDIEFEENFSKDYLEKNGVASVQFISGTAERVENMLKSMDTVIYVLVVSAGLLAFIVLYNLNNININERKRELATIKVLGFYDNEVSKYVYRENAMLTIIGIILGVFMGTVLHRYVIVTVEIDMMMFGRFINLKSYIYSIILTSVFSAIVNGVMYFKLKKIDMIESLKSVE